MDCEYIPTCGFCHTGQERVTTCGRLYTRQGVTAHRKCMQYSATLGQYQFTTFGGFDVDEVRKEIKRGTRLKCTLCKQEGATDVLSQPVGATAGCSYHKCSKTYHFLCARNNGLTKRMVIKKKNEVEGGVLYRVFCKPDHEKEYLHRYYKNTKVVSTEDSDENWDAESEPEDDGSPKPSVSSANVKTELVSQTAKIKPKLRPTRTEAEPSAFDKDDTLGSDSDDLMIGKDRDLAARRYTRNQKEIVQSKIQGSPSPAKRKCSPIRTSPRSKTETKGKAVKGPDSAKKKSKEPHSQIVGEIGDSPSLFKRKKPSLFDVDKGSLSPKKLSMEENVENQDDSFAICLMEEKYSGRTDMLRISRLVQKQFVIAEHRITRWKYGKDVELKDDQMLYLMKEISKALLDQNHEEIYRLLFDLEPADLNGYQSFIEFNRTLGELSDVVKSKLKDTVVANLVQAQAETKKKLGCVLHLEENSVIFVLLITDYIDPNYRIRRKLGHSFATYQWTNNTIAKDITQFNAQVQQYFNHLELKNMHGLLEEKVKGGFDLFVKPSDVTLQLKGLLRVSERLRYYLKLRRKQMESDVTAQCSILFIGPVDTDCLNLKNYCQKCIPLFLEENLTALKEVIVIIDVCMNSGLYSQNDLILLHKIPARTEMEVWSGFDPAIVPVTCVVLHFFIK